MHCSSYAVRLVHITMFTLSARAAVAGSVQHAAESLQGSIWQRPAVSPCPPAAGDLPPLSPQHQDTDCAAVERHLWSSLRTAELPGWPAVSPGWWGGGGGTRVSGFQPLVHGHCFFNHLFSSNCFPWMFFCCCPICCAKTASLDTGWFLMQNFLLYIVFYLFLFVFVFLFLLCKD